MLVFYLWMTIVYYGSMEKVFSLKNSEDTMLFGRRLGQRLKGGECIVLMGDLGAGKTTLTKGIAQGMGVTETVQSPSYGIEAQYEANNGLWLHHFDFYRLDDPELLRYEFEDSMNDQRVVTVVEWADRLGKDTFVNLQVATIKLDYLSGRSGRALSCSGPLVGLFDDW
jgi:tRNA threonylcarbamoyladenosine biosynthesis protein TsaE